MIESALKRLRDQEYEKGKTVPTLDDFIDHEFVESCGRENDDDVTWRRSLRGPPRSRIPWPASSSRKSERTASDGPSLL